MYRIRCLNGIFQKIILLILSILLINHLASLIPVNCHRKCG